MPRFRWTLDGTQPLLMHNCRLADPLDEIAVQMKKLTSLHHTKKTEEVHQELARLEYLGSLYHDEYAGPHIPFLNLERCLLDGARTESKGKRVQRGVAIDPVLHPVVYNGPRDVDLLLKDLNFRNKASVKMPSGGRVIRTRPMFREWSLEVEGTFEPKHISFKELGEYARSAGADTGLGDHRPRFGRFESTVEVVD